MTVYLIGCFIAVFLFNIHEETIAKHKRDFSASTSLLITFLSWFSVSLLLSDFCINKIKTGTWFIKEEEKK
jgi:hypothetical protein